MTPDGFILYTLLVACVVSPITLGFASDPSKKPRVRRVYAQIGTAATAVGLAMAILSAIIYWGTW